MDAEDIGRELPRYADWAPTGFDAKGLNAEGRSNWRVLPIIRTRDSGPLADSNYETAERILADAGVEYWAPRFGHWGPGWIEIIVVAATPDGLRVAGEIASALSDYPILDDSDHSERECEAVSEAWYNWQERDFLRHAESVLSERALAMVEDHGDLLYVLVSGLDCGWEYEGEHPHVGVDPSDLTRDDWAKLLRDIRKAERQGE